MELVVFNFLGIRGNDELVAKSFLDCANNSKCDRGRILNYLFFRGRPQSPGESGGIRGNTTNSKISLQQSHRTNKYTNNKRTIISERLGHSSCLPWVVFVLWFVFLGKSRFLCKGHTGCHCRVCRSDALTKRRLGHPVR